MVSFNLNCIILTTYYTAQTAAKEVQAGPDEGNGVENEPIMGDGGKEDGDNNDNDKDDDNDKGSTPMVLADVYLVKTICAYFNIITQFLSADCFDVDQRASSSDLAEDIKVPNFEVLVHAFL